MAVIEMYTWISFWEITFWLTLDLSVISWLFSVSDLRDKIQFMSLKYVFIGSFQPMAEHCGQIRAIQDFTTGPSLIQNCPLGYLMCFQICIMVWSPAQSFSTFLFFPMCQRKFILLNSVLPHLLYLSLELFPINCLNY